MRFYCNSLESWLLFTSHPELFRVANVVILVTQLSVKQNPLVSPFYCKMDRLFMYMKDFSFYSIVSLLFFFPESFDGFCHVVLLLFFQWSISAAFPLTCSVHCKREKRYKGQQPLTPEIWLHSVQYN